MVIESTGLSLSDLMMSGLGGSKERSSTTLETSSSAAAKPVTNANDIVDPYALIESGKIDRSADAHLRNWATWTLNYRGVVRGYGNRSAVVRSSASRSIDDMLDDMDKSNAAMCDTIIDDLEPRFQAAIHGAYIADVWKFRGDPVQTFISAVEAFWTVGQRKGLI